MPVSLLRYLVCVVSFSASQFVEVSGVCGEFQCQSVG